MAGDGDRLPQRFGDAVRDPGRRFNAGHVFQQDRELVAAQARQRVAFPQAAGQPLRRGHQQGVAGLVAQAVVDDLKVVQVYEQDGDGRVAPPGPLERVFQAVPEEGAVGQARQGIVEGLMGQLVFEPLVVRDVIGRADDPGERPRSVVERHGLRLVRPPPDLDGPGVRDAGEGHVEVVQQSRRVAEDVVDRTPDHPVRLQPQRPQALAVAEREDPLHVQRVDHDGDAGDDGPQPGVALPQRLGRLPLRRDVLDRAQQSDHAAPGVPEWDAVRRRPRLAAPGVPSGLDGVVLGPARLHDPLVARPQPLDGLPVPRQDEVGLAFDLLLAFQAGGAGEVAVAA